MKRLFLVTFVLIAAFACSDDPAPDMHSMIFQYFALNENSETVGVVNPIDNATTFTDGVTFAVNKERLVKVKINSIRFDIDQYICNPSEIWGTLSFRSETGVGNSIFFPIKEDHIEIFSHAAIVTRIERDLLLKGYVNIDFHASILPENTSFTIKGVIAMDVALEYYP